MGQGDGPAAVPRAAGGARTQGISARIHRAHRGQLSASGGWQGAAAFSANFHCRGEVENEAAASVSNFFSLQMRCIVACSMLLGASALHSPARAADAGFT